MKDFLNKLIGSLDNDKVGFSGKKLTAFAVVICVVAAHVKWIALADFSQLIPVLTCDYAFVCMLFGINEYGKKQAPVQ